MAIAHVCIECGFDLARSRPKRDPHYNLPLVICPRCASTSVRRVHPFWKNMRAYRMFDYMLRVLTTQFAMLLAFTIMYVTAIVAVLANVVDGLMRFETDDLGWLLAAVFFVLAPALGAWLTAGFSHLKRSTVWLSWALFMIAALFCLYLFCVAVEEMPQELEEVQAAMGWSRAYGGFVLIVGWGSLVHAIMMLCALAGIPLGRLILWLIGWVNRTMWRWRRRRKRLLRAA